MGNLDMQFCRKSTNQKFSLNHYSRLCGWNHAWYSSCLLLGLPYCRCDPALGFYELFPNNHNKNLINLNTRCVFGGRHSLKPIQCNLWHFPQLLIVPPNCSVTLTTQSITCNGLRQPWTKSKSTGLYFESIDFNFSLAIVQHIHNSSPLCYFWTSKTSFNHTSHTCETVIHNSSPEVAISWLVSHCAAACKAVFRHISFILHSTIQTESKFWLSESKCLKVIALERFDHCAKQKQKILSLSLCLCCCHGRKVTKSSKWHVRTSVSRKAEFRHLHKLRHRQKDNDVSFA